MFEKDIESAKGYARRLLNIIRAGGKQSDAERAISRIYKRVGLKAPKVVWCDNTFQFMVIPIILSLVAKGWSLEVLKLCCFQLRKDPLLERLWQRIAEQNLQETGAVGPVVTSRLTSKIADMSYNLTIAANRAVGSQRMDRIEEGLDEILAPFSSTVMDNSTELLRAQCAFRAKFKGLVLPSEDYMLGQAWGSWDFRWLLSHGCALELIESQMYKSEAQRTGLADWLTLTESGQSYLFFENICLVARYSCAVREDDSQDGQMKGTPMAVGTFIEAFGERLKGTKDALFRKVLRVFTGMPTATAI